MSDKKKRKHVAWTRVEYDGSPDTYLESRTDITRNGLKPLSGKYYHKCPYAGVRFHCPYKMRIYTDVDGNQIIEEAGVHQHSPEDETIKYGFAKHVSDYLLEILRENPTLTATNLQQKLDNKFHIEYDLNKLQNFKKRHARSFLVHD